MLARSAKLAVYDIKIPGLHCGFLSRERWQPVLESEIDRKFDREGASLARTGGNTTGLATIGNDLAGKRLELLREVIPRLPPLGDHGQRHQSFHRIGNDS